MANVGIIQRKSPEVSLNAPSRHMANHGQYCVSGVARDCDEVDGEVEACGALFQSDTGMKDDPVPQGVFLRRVSGDKVQFHIMESDLKQSIG